MLNSGADHRITGVAYGDRVGHGLINTLLSGAASGATYYLLQRAIEGKVLIQTSESSLFTDLWRNVSFQR